MRGVLSRLKTSNDPLIIVRDSQPAAVMLPYMEYKRLSGIERQLLKAQMDKVWDDMRKRNVRVSDKELDVVIEEAKKHARRSR
jgi:PHD/YefM family antitoxin component YafN of YafNO toxin-antitoxin module